MNITPIQNMFGSTTAATSAMGEAFDRACKSLRNFGSNAPAIIANQIIAAAKVGERDARPSLRTSIRGLFDIDDTSMLVVSVGRDPPVPTYASVTHSSVIPSGPG